MDYQNIEYIIFENNSDLPVNVASFKRGHFAQQNETVGPGEKKLLHSKLGVWCVNTFVEERDLWINRGLSYVYSIGEFFSKKNVIYGTYSDITHPELFEFEYSELVKQEEGAFGMITFSLK